MSSGALEAVDRILNRGGDADDVLRAIVETLVERGVCAWAGVFLLEEGELVLGPQAGTPDDAARTVVAVEFRGDRVGELAADGAADRAVLERVALLISPYALLGWDTGGVAWENL